MPFETGYADRRDCAVGRHVAEPSCLCRGHCDQLGSIRMPTNTAGASAGTATYTRTAPAPPPGPPAPSGSPGSTPRPRPASSGCAPANTPPVKASSSPSTPAPKANGIRIDEGVPGSSSPSQQVDHVVVRSGGRILGPDGEPIVGSLRDNPQAHLPLSDWLNWTSWNAP